MRQIKICHIQCHDNKSNECRHIISHVLRQIVSTRMKKGIEDPEEQGEREERERRLASKQAIIYTCSSLQLHVYIIACKLQEL